MFEIIVEMIHQAERANDYNLIVSIRKLIKHLALTANCLSDWRSVEEKLLKVYQDNQWVYDNLELLDYES